jgi:hypothetical protein
MIRDDIMALVIEEAEYGNPVTIEELVTRTGRTTMEVRRAVDALVIEDQLIWSARNEVELSAGAIE